MKGKEKPAFVVIWEFRVARSNCRKFESAYGPGGEWAKFFSRTRDNGYIETQLIHDRSNSQRYLTLDFWTSKQAYSRFKKENRLEYNAIDQRCESLTESESRVGRFSIVGSGGSARPRK